MKIKYYFLSFLLTCYLASSLAQPNRLKYIGIEAGTTSIESEIANMDQIRGSMPNYYYGYSTSSITSLSYKNYIGIKYEILSLNDRFGLFGGIRYSHVKNTIGKSDYWTNNTKYFYWLSYEDGVNTEYLKVNEIVQQSDYIGIPVEIRYFTGRRPRQFQFYIKLGMEVNCLLNSKEEVLFSSAAMNPYKKDVTTKLENPGRIYAAAYGGAGFKIGRDQKPSVSFEANMPYLVMTYKTSGILKPIVGGGFQLNFQIPLKTKAQ